MAVINDPWDKNNEQPPDISEIFNKLKKSIKQPKNGKQPNMDQSKSFKVILSIVLVLVLISFVSSTYYTVNSGTVGVLATFGKYNDEVKVPGLHFKIPIMQNLHTVDIKMQTAHYFGNRDMPDEDGVVNRPGLKVLDNKSLPIGIELSVQYTPIASDASKILSQYGRNYFDKLINPLVRDIVRNVIGNYNAESIAQQRSKIGTEISIKLTKRMSGLPFQLTNIALRNIQLPEIVLKKVKEVQLAKQEEQRLAMVEKQAKKEQQIKTIQAKTRLIEVTTSAKADAEKKRIEADAKSYQIKKEAEALAEANKLIAASVTSELINYHSVEKWDGQYPRMILSGGQGNGLMISLPDVTSNKDR